MRLRITALAIALLFILEWGVPSVSAPPNQTPSLPTQITLSVVPGVIPADNSTYQAIVVALVDRAGLPTVATNDTTVYLTSSVGNVGKIQSSVTISLGKDFALANFTTTKTPGETVITASSTGLQSASLSVTTKITIGFPTHLSITSVPSTTIARTANKGRVLIELQDDAGLPAKAIADTVVSLYSSNTKVLNLSTSSLTIKTGQFVQLANYTTSFVPGSAFVTASATGFGSGSTQITVLGQPPLALRLYAQPSQMVQCVPPVVSCLGRLVVALVDLNGNPTPAPRDITVFVRSSNLTVITIPQDNIKIKAGNISATAAYQTTAKNGDAKISVSSPGLQSDFQTVTVPVLAKQTPDTIRLYVGPAVVLANHRSYSSVVVALQKQGNPAVNASGPTTVVLTSSRSDFGNITKVYLTIPPGENFKATVFTSTFQVGTTTLTASAHNLLPDQASLSTFGPVPSKVVLKALSSALPADGKVHPAFEILLEDSFGSPAVAPYEIPVNMTSSQDGLIRVTSTFVQRGEFFKVANVTTGVLAGAGNVTAFSHALSSGYSQSSAIVRVIVPAPSALAAYTLPSSGIFNKNIPPLLVVQLQDAAGNPARAREATDVTITSSNATVYDGTLHVKIPAGTGFVEIPINVRKSGSVTFTLISPSLTTATVTLSLISAPFAGVISPASQGILTNQTASITVSAFLLGKPAKGVHVIWNATAGRLSTINSTTNKQGSATVMYTPSGPGPSTITAMLSHPVLGRVNLTSFVVVTQAIPPAPGPSLLQQLLSFPYILGIGGAAVGIVMALLIITLRRRKGKGESGEDALQYVISSS